MMSNKTRLLILQGISGSGKSTYANNLCCVDPDWVVINRDSIREGLLGKQLLEQYFAQGMDFSIEQEVTKREQTAMAKAIAAGKKVILDNTNLQKKYVVAAIKLYYEVVGVLQRGCVKDDIFIKKFDCSLEGAEKNIKKRGERLVSRQVLQQQYARYQSINWELSDVIPDAWELFSAEEKHWYLPKFEVEPYIADTTKPTAVICDIDGTLAHRVLLTTPKIHYRSFYDYKDCETDEPDPLVAAALIGFQKQGIKILFVSGRKESAEKNTRDFLAKTFGPDFEYELITRDTKIDRTEDNHDAPDDRVKYRLFNDYIRENYNVLGVIDDRKKVVAFWEALGLRVMNVGLLNEEF